VKYSEKIMNCILKMPVRVYFEFLRICELTSREYAVLKSSHVEPILPGDYNVETLCDVNDADLLLDRAKQLCPQTIPYIERALASVRLLRSYSEGSYFVSTTTSTQDSGLLDVLVPLFEKQTGYHVKTVSLGTGRALALAAKGEADVALVHAPSLEKQYVAERKLLNRRLVMYNDFVIIGPKDDPAKVRSATSASGGLKAIEQAKANFVSRGDNSGTHVLEKSLWKAAGIEPKGTWYIETRQGMGATLGIANERNAYTITDRGTYLALRNSQPFAQQGQLANFSRRRPSTFEYLLCHGSESRQRNAHQFRCGKSLCRFHGRAGNPERHP
jgi:ABC-type tungstate transport system permease subunit